MKHWSAIRAGINTGLTADASSLVRHDCIGSKGALSGARGTDIHAWGFFAVLADSRHEDRDLFPLLHPYSRKGRAARTLMGKATDHFAGMASCATFWDDGDSAHLRGLHSKFYIVND
jgi:hypothetical protein